MGEVHGKRERIDFSLDGHYFSPLRRQERKGKELDRITG